MFKTFKVYEEVQIHIIKMTKPESCALCDKSMFSYISESGFKLSFS